MDQEIEWKENAGSWWKLKRSSLHHFEWTANVVPEEKVVLSKLRKIGKEIKWKAHGTEWNIFIKCKYSYTTFPPKCPYRVFYPMPSSQKDFLKSCCMFICSEITLGNLLLGALPAVMLLQATPPLHRGLGTLPVQGQLCKCVGEVQRESCISWWVFLFFFFLGLLLAV